MKTFKRFDRPLLLLAVSAMVGGCTWAFGPRDDDLSEMHQRFSRTFDVQTGLIHGDLDQVRTAARWIATQPNSAAVHPDAEASHQNLIRHAERLAQAQDLREAARHTGQLAAACGQCHQDMGAGPNFVVGQDSPEGDSQEAQMVRHLWAADRMWEGLVGPSETSWEAGASALAETGPSLVHALRTSSGPEETSTLVQTVGAVAGRAQVASTSAERAEVYGEMLATCNSCHVALGIMVEER